MLGEAAAEGENPRAQPLLSASSSGVHVSPHNHRGPQAANDGVSGGCSYSSSLNSISGGVPPGQRTVDRRTLSGATTSDSAFWMHELSASQALPIDDPCCSLTHGKPGIQQARSWSIPRVRLLVARLLGFGLHAAALASRRDRRPLHALPTPVPPVAMDAPLPRLWWPLLQGLLIPPSANAEHEPRQGLA